MTRPDHSGISSEKRKKIILIDDDSKFLEKLSYLFDQSGFSCQAVSDSRVAVKKILSEKFDVVVTDIQMPGLNGFEIIDAAKKSSPQSFIVVTSGGDDSKIKAKALDFGADVFFSKPLNLVSLLKTITQRNPNRSKEK